MNTTLTPAQELIVVKMRKTLLLVTDDLLAVTPEVVNPADLRAGLDRYLRRHGVEKKPELFVKLVYRQTGIVSFDGSGNINVAANFSCQ